MVDSVLLCFGFGCKGRAGGGGDVAFGSGAMDEELPAIHIFTPMQQLTSMNMMNV